MKNRFTNYLCAIFAFALILSCDSAEDGIYDGDTLLSFETALFASVSVPAEDLNFRIPVLSTDTADSDRSYPAIITSATDGTSNEYSVGTITIPAGAHEGYLSIDFDFSEISGEDGDVKQIVLSIDPPAGVSSYSDEVTINYFREIVCNDLELTIISDVWALETGFRLEQADGTILVNDFFPFPGNSATPQEYNVMFNLADGDYKFILLDSYGDGQVGTGGGVTLTGSYSLTCSIITHAAGEGELDNGFFEETLFTVNP